MEKVDKAIQKSIYESVASLGVDVTLDDIEVKNTTDPRFGDKTSTIALKLSKKVGKSPMDFAKDIVSSLKVVPSVSDIQVVKPGFINFHIADEDYKKVLEKINSDYGKGSLGQGRKVMIEYGDINTHKAMHVGHVKNLISGNCIENLYKNMGFDVITANYYGDVGMQVAKCTWGSMQKGIPDDFITWDINLRAEYMDDCYVYAAQKYKEDKRAQKEIRQINKEIYAYYKNENTDKTENSEVVRMYLFWRKVSKEHQKEIFQYLDVAHDEDYPESSVAEDAVAIIKSNTGPEAIFQEDDGAVIFRGEDYGLRTWVFINSEGNPTYSGKDMGLAERKMEDYPDLDLSIMMTSVEQIDYFKAVIKAIELLHPEYIGKFKHIPFGWLLIENKKTSSRKGNALKGRDLIQLAIEQAQTKISARKKYKPDEIDAISSAVGIAALKFLILSREFHKDVNFDPENFVVLEGFSGPYIMYGYARANSILEKAAKNGVNAKLPDSLDEVLNSSEEIDLLKKLSEFPGVAEKAYELTSPHLVCNYLFELAKLFSNFYDKHSVLGLEDSNVAAARLKLVEAVSVVLKSGLALLGIRVVEQM
ncbi:arginine--tRNA ligase [Candidatus Dojkabacteria bacterium]|nr:arginine--tRNA ligase [Candidatus Dojkabacteria bacterium]